VSPQQSDHGELRVCVHENINSGRGGQRGHEGRRVVNYETISGEECTEQIKDPAASHLLITGHIICHSTNPLGGQNRLLLSAAAAAPICTHTHNTYKPSSSTRSRPIRAVAGRRTLCSSCADAEGCKRKRSKSRTRRRIFAEYFSFGSFGEF
jgi:hypothetical protein